MEDYKLEGLNDGVQDFLLFSHFIVGIYDRSYLDALTASCWTLGWYRTLERCMKNSFVVLLAETIVDGFTIRVPALPDESTCRNTNNSDASWLLR